MTTPPQADSEQVAEPDVEPAPLLTLRDGLPRVIDTPEGLAEAVAALAAGTGPVAIDAERASGYRYSARAYLIQLRRTGSGTHLIDPTPFGELTELNDAIGEAEWILHAATQDLVCLRDAGLRPQKLFDTEHAARLLGYPRVGLATLVESILGFGMRKEHSAADWSQRPLPESWLEYAALDVEVLIELRAHLAAELEETGKAEWAQQEFVNLMGFEPVVRPEPWRRTSGIHRLRKPRVLAAVRELWVARDDIARTEDVTPGRIIPDSAIVAAAQAMPRNRGALLATSGFQGRGARRFSERWVEALEIARTLPETELPAVSQRSDGPPQARSWADRDPAAAARLAAAKISFAALSEETKVPLENLLTPDSMRRVLWQPPSARDDALLPAVEASLRDLGARPWQIELTAPLLVDAILTPAEASDVE